MSQEIVISSNPVETTVAIREDNRLVEICVEHTKQRSITGSIYKGRVTRVLPGMQSAFVDLGLQRDAFLYVSDVVPRSGMNAEVDPAQSSAAASADAKGGPAKAASPGSPQPARTRRRRRRRRRRRKRPSGQGPRAQEPSVAQEAAVAATDTAPTDGEPGTVLPGESLAKYRGRRRGRRRRGRRTSAGSAASGNGRHAEPSAEGPASADDGILEPPTESATVEPPPIVANLWSPLKWLTRKKPAAPSQPERKQPATPTRRPRRRPRRTGKAAPAARAGEKAPAKHAKPEAQKGRPKHRTRRRRKRPSGPGRRAAWKRSANGSQSKAQEPTASISELLKPGQEVIVQVNKEPVGKKGARITSHVNLPGRYTVFMTSGDKNGVAKQIQPESERTRLRKLADRLTEGKQGSFVVRTAAGGVSDEELAADIDHLRGLWDGIRGQAESATAPAELHRDLDVVERVLRDHLSEDCRAVWVDSKEQHERVAAFAERFRPSLADRIKLYEKNQPILEAFGIRKDVERALRPKVWLKSGGYLVINQTEALVAIDVNTGRYVGQSDRLEDTVLKTNLEAAEEVARQLRLRDLGGIIVVDFIDMENRKNRQKVHQVMHEALKRMKSPSRLLPFNEFGMVVITRKSARHSLERAMCMPCPSCSGAGTVKSSETVLSEVFSAVSRRGRNSRKSGNGRDGRELTLRVHPEVARSLKRRASSHLHDLEVAAGASLTVKGDGSMHPEKFRLS